MSDTRVEAALAVASVVGLVEAEVARDPAEAFTFDDGGRAVLRAAGQEFFAGRFGVVAVGELRRRVLVRGRRGLRGRVRLDVAEGTGPATDVGLLQSTTDDAVFQVASQFNCLEAPSPTVVPVAAYADDPTQGPRAALSAFPGALLRHYAAPDDEGGRFVQVRDGRQLELLGPVCQGRSVRVRNGYLSLDDVTDPRGFAAHLAQCEDEIRVGLHEDVEVVGGRAGHRATQVLCSTLALGSYSRSSWVGAEELCAPLLRAAYRGTLLAALALGRRRCVLTLVGGGVFGNPRQVIWDAIGVALDEAAAVAPQDLSVVVNARSLVSDGERSVVEGLVGRHEGSLVRV